MVVLEDGTVVDPYERNFFEKDDQYHTILPEGSTKEDFFYTDLYPTFDDFMSEYHGVTGRDENEHRYGYWENPNAKWDWYQIGGRWSGFFKMKEGWTGGVEERSWTNRDTESEDDQASQVLREGVDLDGMRDEAAIKAGETYDSFVAYAEANDIDCSAFIPWLYFMDAVQRIRDELTATFDEGAGMDYREHFAPANEALDIARTAFHDQPCVKAFNTEEAREQFGYFWDTTPAEIINTPREDYVQEARDQVGVPYAMLYKGEWLSKGDMGWFGITTGENMTDAEWARRVSELYDAMPGDTLLTLVDCHI
jgi:hypothetical protein